MKSNVSDLLLNNKNMLLDIAELNNNNFPTDGWYKRFDCLKLSPLHYAMILRKKELFLQMLRKQFKSYCRQDYINFERSSILELSVLAEYLNLNLTSEIFEVTSYEYRTISRMIRIEKMKLGIQEKALRTSKRMESIARKAISIARSRKNYRAIEDCERKLSRILNNRADLENSFYSIKNHLYELENELENYVKNEYKRRLDSLKELKNSQSDFYINLRNIINTPGKIIEILKLNESDFVEYFINGLRVAIPKNWVKDNERKTSSFKSSNDAKNKENRKAKVERPYGKSWFSPSAHNDRNILKSEYRELVKKYHPDVFHYENAKEIFQEILAEKMDILEKIN